MWQAIQPLTDNLQSPYFLKAEAADKLFPVMRRIAKSLRRKFLLGF